MDLPCFADYKSKKYAEMKKYKDNDFQKNKKLVTLVMKQVPLQTKSLPKPKAMDPAASNGVANGDKPADKLVLEKVAKPTKESQQGGELIPEEKNKGKAADPICLD